MITAKGSPGAKLDLPYRVTDGLSPRRDRDYVTRYAGTIGVADGCGVDLRVNAWS
jgi:hypothetical protein